MDVVNQVLGAVEGLLTNPWALTFFSLFVFGWLLKEKSRVKNILIPWILCGAGGILGFFLLVADLKGVLVGCIIAWIMMGQYDQVKGLVQYLFIRNVNKD